MKLTLAMVALAGLAVAGCSTDRDYYGASDEGFSTPSWGTSSTTVPATGQTETMTPSAGEGHGTQPQMPPNYSGDSGTTPPGQAPDFGPQRR